MGEVVIGPWVKVIHIKRIPKGSRSSKRLAAILFPIALLASPAAAHDWHPPQCCSGRDCYPVEDDAVTMTPAGWLIRATGEVIPASKAQFSPDGRFHRCSVRGELGEKTLCLFVPGQAF